MDKINLQYPLGSYSAANPPSNNTLMGDLDNCQQAINQGSDEIASLQSAISTSYSKSEVDALLLATKQALYPVGSYYSNGAVSTDPATLLGFGTWIPIAGKVIVGLDAAQTEFAALLQTGGEKTHLLTGAESGEKGHSHSDSGHVHGEIVTTSNSNSSPYYPTVGSRGNTSGLLNNSGQTETSYANISSTPAANASSAHNNLQPYEVAALWRRTA